MTENAEQHKVTASGGDYRMSSRERDEHASPHAAAAVRHILAGLAARGIKVKTVDEAIQQGHLTDLEWCDVLDDFRERYGRGRVTGIVSGLAPAEQRAYRAQQKVVNS